MNDDTVEYAMLRRADGSLVPRPAALKSLEGFRRAIALAGGRAPRDRDGRTMIWNELRGWHPRSDAGARHRTLEDLMRLQEQVGLDICLDRLSASINAEWRRK